MRKVYRDNRVLVELKHFLEGGTWSRLFRLNSQLVRAQNALTGPSFHCTNGKKKEKKSNLQVYMGHYDYMRRSYF